MKTEWIDKWAQLLVHYSLDVHPGDEIKVRGGVVAADLLRAVVVTLLRAGAHPRVSVSLPDMQELLYTYASDDQLAHCSEIDLFDAQHSDGFILISCEENTRALNAVAPEKQVATVRATKEIRDTIVSSDNWVKTLYPTSAYAQDAEMSTADFATMMAEAMFLTEDDPVERWRALHTQQEVLRQRLDATQRVRIVGPDTDLTLSVAGRTAVNSDGQRNMPSGEVFTAPIEDSAEGYITFSYPVCAYGREIAGIRLEFSGGKIVHYSAEKNVAFLESILHTDDGARRLGELGIGTNFGITRFVKNILFDEKIGGTVHLAIGKSYEKCGGKNVSAVHWDMIKDLREGGTLYFDDEPVQVNGVFNEDVFPHAEK